MRPLSVLLGIVMGSTVSIALGLFLTLVVFLLLPEYSLRLADERKPLLGALALSSALAVVSAGSFYGELRQRRWRVAAQIALALLLAVGTWLYWPQ
jgi:hypothetical protein